MPPVVAASLQLVVLVDRGFYSHSLTPKLCHLWSTPWYCRQLMEEQALRQPVMVSRLPKFGSRPTGGSTHSVPNGSATPSVPTGGKVLAQVGHNGIVRPTPTLTFKWKGEKVEPDYKLEESRGGAYRPQQQQKAPITVRDIKKPSPPMATVRRSASAVSASSYRTTHHPTPMRPNQGLSNGLMPGPTHSSLSLSSDSLRLLPPDHMVRSQSFSHMTGAAITRSFSFNQELPHPNARHIPPLRSSLTLPPPILNGGRGGKTAIGRAPPAISTPLLPPTNLKKPLLPAPASSKPSALSYRLMRPSLIRQPRPTPIGRAQEEPVKEIGQKEQKEGSQVVSVALSSTERSGSPSTIPQADLPVQTQTEKPREDQARPDQIGTEDVKADSVGLDEARIEDSTVLDQTEHQTLEVEHRLEELQTEDTREEGSRPDSPTKMYPGFDGPESDKPRALDLSAVKTIDPGAEEPSLDESNVDDISGTTDRENVERSPPDQSPDPGPERVGVLPALCVTSITGETLEDMSLSSTSSLEHNDTSEEYMDDFDNFGNGGDIMLLSAHDAELVQSEPLSEDNTPASRHQDACSVTSLHSFLSESVDWGEMGLTGGKEAFSMPGGGVSSDGVFRDGSSLDLSPSDSSGATYMWDDEDGLEPLGGAMIPCGSYDSDLNSMDILNNLENLESCDLDEDDLMLDVDLPEDASLHSEADGRSHWRRRQQQLWGRQEHLHNNNNSDEVLQALACLDVDAVDHVSLDELTLQHIAQDCTSVKNQLLQLKQLLQVEETDCSDEGVSSSEAFTPDPSEDISSDQQVQDLLMEVQKLREELKNKDKIIAQLTQQMQCVPEEASRCSCHLKKPEPQKPETQKSEAQKPEVQKGIRPLHQDGSTQTPWRGHAPQILRPSRGACAPRSHQGALVTPPHSQTLHAPPQHLSSGGVTAVTIVRPQKHQSCPPLCPDLPMTEPGAPQTRPPQHHPLHLTLSGSRVGRGRHAGRTHTERAHRRPAPGPADRREPLPEKDSAVAPAPHPSASATPLPTGATAPLTERVGQRPRQLPPPSRGLPSFSTAPQACIPAPVTALGLPLASGPARSALVPPKWYRHNPPSAPPLSACPARDPDNGPPHTRPLASPTSSRLPKPKSH
ncbi:hypothetical protein ACEWY4_003723 [Coilia grayii]|uniref:Serine-rich coiled-coil domain-containing protein 2-like n=1 Tax=Coilia grayii TaxID=363190 RepID=A0ABD1KS22_9TELE